MIWGIFLHGCYCSTKSLLKIKIRKQSNRSKCKVYPVALKKWPRWEVVNRKTATALTLGKETAKRQSWRTPLPPRSQLVAVFSCCLSLADSAEKQKGQTWTLWAVLPGWRDSSVPMPGLLGSYYQKWLSPCFLNCHLHTGGVGWKYKGKGPLIPMLCPCVLSLGPWGAGRTTRWWMRDWQAQSWVQPDIHAQHPGSCQSWLVGLWTRKCHSLSRYLTLHYSFQTLYPFFTLKSASDATFKKSYPTSPISNPTLESSIMLLGDIGVRPTPPDNYRVLKMRLNETYLPVLNFKINTCLPESFDINKTWKKIQMDMKPPKQKYGLGHPPCLLMSPVSSKGHFTAFVSCILSCLESATKKMAIDSVSNCFSTDTQSLH